MRRVLALALLVLMLTTGTAEALTFREAKGQIRKIINRNYEVNRGPYVYNCRGSSRYVRCDVDFRAGIYWHCGYGVVREANGYWYTRLLAPIGC